MTPELALRVLAKRLASCVLVCSALCVPNRAQAFSDPASFAQPTPAAGGGGRYFTGSPADAYTCKVCHEGGVEPRLKVFGLPVGGYRPSSAYEIVIDWSDTLDKFSTALEITDLQGGAAGSVRLPPQAELLPAELCEPVGDGIPAASIAETSDGRHVITVPDCGAKHVRLLWTAPARDLGRLWFAGSAVASNGEADAQGDGVTDFGRVIGSASSTEPIASQVDAGCAVVPGQDNSVWCWLIAFGSFALRRVRRVRSRCRRA